MIVKIEVTDATRAEIIQWCEDNEIPALMAAEPAFVDTATRRIHWCQIVTSIDDPVSSLNDSHLGEFNLRAEGGLIGDEERPRLVLMRDTPLRVDVPEWIMANHRPRLYLGDVPLRMGVREHG